MTRRSNARTNGGERGKSEWLSWQTETTLLTRFALESDADDDGDGDERKAMCDDQAWKIDMLGLVAASEHNILRSLKATKPNSSIPKPGDDRPKWRLMFFETTHWWTRFFGRSGDSGLAPRFGLCLTNMTAGKGQR